MPPCILPKGEPKMPAVDAVFMNLSSVSTSLIGEYEWLNQVVTKIVTTEEPARITWAGYHAEKSFRELQPKPIIAM